MRLKEDYDTLKNNVKNFIKTNSDLIDTQNFAEIYYKLLDEFFYNRDGVGIFTGILLKAGINPLDRMRNMPDSFLLSNKTVSYIDIPDNVTTLGSKAFFNSGIRKLVLPPKITIIPDSFCTSTYDLKTVDFSKCTGLGLIEPFAFSTCAIETLDISNTKIALIEHHAFERCHCLTHANLAESNLHIINNSAFEYCTSLKKVDFTNGLLQIGQNAFAGCANLTEVRLPESISTIQMNAFAGCNLKKLYIPKRFENTDMLYRCGITSKTEVIFY